MMFVLNLTVSVGLLAIVAGMFLYMWSLPESAPSGSGFARTIGLIVVILAIFSTLCSGFYGLLYWQEGYFQTPFGMRGMKMQDQPMMGGGMSNMMMNQQMNKKQEGRAAH